MSADERRHDPLLPAALQARLAALEVALRRSLPSSRRGDRRSPNKKGISLEFADFRGYVAGDDVRHLDWASYARLDQLIVKLYHDEEDAHLNLIVDASRSMGFGDPTKLRLASQVAAAMAWIALKNSWRVSLAVLGDSLAFVPPALGEGSLPRFLSILQDARASGRRPLVEAVRAYAREQRPRGAVVLLSDLFDPSGVDELLRPLQRPTTEVTLVQVLAREDIDPDLTGDLRLIDSESGEVIEVDAERGLLDTYRERARGWVARCAEICRRRGVAFVSTASDTPIETLLLRDLVSQRVLR